MTNLLRLILVVCLNLIPVSMLAQGAPLEYLSGLHENQEIADFRVIHLYGDDGAIVGMKLTHIATGTPVFLLQIETVPQVFTWVDVPAESNNGFSHALEHLLDVKGTKGRYYNLLVDMTFSESTAATLQDFNYYGFESGSGMRSFFQLFHAWLDTLYHPDFTDAEAEREFYHFGVTVDPKTGRRTLVEEGTVYNEMQSNQGIYTYLFELNKRALGNDNPFGFFYGGSPDQIRGTTPEQIRRFHDRHYKLGPTTGFIFVIDPKESVPDFLRKISDEFHQIPWSENGNGQRNSMGQAPKYPIHSSDNQEIRIYPFPDSNPTTPGEVRFSWRPVKVETQLDLKLMQLFFAGLAGGERSLLYKSLLDSRTREVDLGGTTVESEPFLREGPAFPLWNIGVSGIPGNRINPEAVKKLRDLIIAKIKEVSEYPDHSQGLNAFNSLIQSYAKTAQVSRRVWTKNAPRFGAAGLPVWKDLLEYLEMDASFVRSLSEQTVWLDVNRQLISGENIWRGLIEKYRILEPPFAMGSTPSAQLQEDLDKDKRKRIRQELELLLSRYHCNDEQEALAKFEQDEVIKTKEIDNIAAMVAHPPLTANPPLTPDDDIQYQQFLLENVPVIASVFDRPPTIDVDLAFDLSHLPRRYYKYLSIIPRYFDSIGLKVEGSVISYSELLSRIREHTYRFSLDNSSDPVSGRADLVIRISVIDTGELRAALELVQQIMNSNYLHIDNVGRLQDIANQIAGEDSYLIQSGPSVWDQAIALRYQSNELYVSLNSFLARAHWDGRLPWLVHKRVSAEDIEALGQFAESLLSSKLSRRQLSEKLNSLAATGLEKELVNYWQKNLFNFSEETLPEGLRQLTLEVKQDLEIGPERTIEDLQELQRLIFTRDGLHLTLTADKASLDKMQPDILRFLDFLPSHPANSAVADKGRRLAATSAHLDHHFPWYLGLVTPAGTTGTVAFTARVPDYAQVDRNSLIESLASNLFAGEGPDSFYMKATEAGLAYNSSIGIDRKSKLLWYYADRSPDVPALLELVNATAAKTSKLHNQFLVDYALRQTLSTPRSMYSISDRGRAIADDIRDGNTPEKIRRFSKALLELRNNPDLAAELKRAAPAAMGTVLPGEGNLEFQSKAQSIFIFATSEEILKDVEKRLPRGKLQRAWPSDFWIQ